MKAIGLDHIVLSCRDVGATLAFYRDVLGMAVREERPGKWSLVFGTAKISLQDEAAKPAIAAQTLPGTANLCLLIEDDVGAVADVLGGLGIEAVSALTERDGAMGPVRSFHFRDPEGNLVEVANSV